MTQFIALAIPTISPFLAPFCFEWVHQLRNVPFPKWSLIQSPSNLADSRGGYRNDSLQHQSLSVFPFSGEFPREAPSNQRVFGVDASVVLFVLADSIEHGAAAPGRRIERLVDGVGARIGAVCERGLRGRTEGKGRLVRRRGAAPRALLLLRDRAVRLCGALSLGTRAETNANRPAAARHVHETPADGTVHVRLDGHLGRSDCRL